MLKHFFIICSGADTDLLDQCSKGEQTKYVGIGATVFFTAVMAFIASSYALFMVFDNIFIAIIFGIVWALLIFNLDRFIVSTIKKKESFTQELLQALPRLVLAMIIAVVISKPLELKIFEKEINQVLLEQKNEMTLVNSEQIALQYTPKIEEYKSKIAVLKQEVISKEKEVNNLYDTYISEAEGRAGTKLLGKGPVYEEKRQKHDAALTELQNLKLSNTQKISALETDIKNLNSQQEQHESLTQPIITNFDGVMARITALGKLPWLPSFFIFILFLAIETSPIIAKLLAQKSAYDFKLEDQESEIKTWASQKIYEREQHLITVKVVSKQVYQDLQNEKPIYNHKKEKSEDLIKYRADVFFQNQKQATS
jgi:MFS superfamily sulfate permease-like transporter